MKLLNKNDVKELMESDDGIHLSIYLPTGEVGQEVEQGKIRLKNLLKKAEKELLNHTDEIDKDKFLKPVKKLLTDMNFWNYQNKGLAIFISPERFEYYRLPLDFEEVVVVSDSFHVKPLVPLITNDTRFYILALSQNNLKLFQCTKHTITELRPEGIPYSLDEALKYDDPEEENQYTSHVTAGANNSKSVMYHGQGSGDDVHKKDILRYFQLVDQGLNDYFRQEEFPLVLAGVKYLFSIFKEANSYSNLMEEGIPGNPENLNAKELHKRAWDVVEKYFVKEQNKAIEEYNQLSNTDRTSEDVKEIVSASYMGKVDTLIVARNHNEWGYHNPKFDRVVIHDSKKDEDIDLLNYAVTHTLKNGGNVYIIEKESIPKDSNAVAIYRFS